jgi:hypothetical protein
MPPGSAGPRLHRHDFDEAFYVIDGELTFHLDSELVTVGAGALAFAPGGVPHTFANRGTAPAHYVCQSRQPASNASSPAARRARTASTDRVGRCRNCRRWRRSGRRSERSDGAHGRPRPGTAAQEAVRRPPITRCHEARRVRDLGRAGDVQAAPDDAQDAGGNHHRRCRPFAPRSAPLTSHHPALRLDKTMCRWT